LPQFEAEENESVRLNENEGSWFAANFFIIGIFICPFGGVLSGYLGRKKTILLCTPFLWLGWLMLGLAHNKIMIFGGRSLTSFGICLIMPSVGKYCAILKLNCLKIIRTYAEEENCEAIFRRSGSEFIILRIPNTENGTFFGQKKAVIGD
jgi:hypothetical protein